MRAAVHAAIKDAVYNVAEEFPRVRREDGEVQQLDQEAQSGKEN